MLIRLTPSLDVWYNPLPEARFIICCTRDARRPIFTAKERAASVLDVAVWQIPPAGIDNPERSELHGEWISRRLRKSRHHEKI